MQVNTHVLLPLYPASSWPWPTCLNMRPVLFEFPPMWCNLCSAPPACFRLASIPQQSCGWIIVCTWCCDACVVQGFLIINWSHSDHCTHILFTVFAYHWNPGSDLVRSVRLVQSLAYLGYRQSHRCTTCTSHQELICTCAPTRRHQAVQFINLGLRAFPRYRRRIAHGVTEVTPSVSMCCCRRVFVVVSFCSLGIYVR